MQMKKEITALSVLTILSALLVPITCVICKVDKIPSEVIYLPTSLYTWGQYANLVVTAILVTFVFGLFSLLFYYEKLKKIYFIFLYLLNIFIIIVEIFCLSKFGLAISPPMTSIMADTNNFLEVKGFFQTYFDLSAILIIIGTLLISWLIWHYSQKIYDFVENNKKTFIGIFIALIAFSLYGTHKVGGLTCSPPIMKTIYCAKYWLKVKGNLAKLSSDKTNRVEITQNNADTPFVIFVIGESEARHFMGMYNTKYDSTPFCNKLIDSGNMFAFTDTISMKSSTAQVMTPLLSFMDNTTETTDLTKFDPIVDVFTKAGYQAFWISNHEKITKDLSYATYMSTRCNYSTFTAKISGNTEFTSYLCLKDEVMLPHLDNYIKNQVPQKDKNLFCFQIMGSHIRYPDRYPDSFKHFKASDVKEEGFKDNQKELLASYLNTIYYTDYILNEIINRFKDKDAFLVYVSDHGEEMWQAGFQGHGPTNVSKYMVEIPFLIWVSDKYKEKNPQIVGQIKNSTNKPFMTDNLVHVLLDLAKIETKQYDATKSVINKAYIPKERVVVNGIKYEELRK
jgi:heptose-I-phosphate ethanolaminephosphotransferase